MAKKENKNKIELTVKIEGEEWTKAIDKAFKEKVKTVTIDGFRKGKCPRDVFEKKYGKETLYIDAAKSLLQDAYRKVMDDNKEVIPVAQPRVDIKSIDDEKVEFVFTIVTAPEVKVKKYKGLKVARDEVNVTKEEIEHELGHLLEKYTELVTKEGKVENGDIAVIDFEGFKDGVAFDGGKGENYSLTIGSHSFIPGFEEGIVGMSKGEEKDLELTFPEDYMSEELKGQKVVFKVKVNEVKSRIVPELDEEFFADLGMDNIKTKEDLEKSIKEEILAEKNHELGHKFEDDLLDKASENMEVSFADELVEDEKEAMYQDLVKRMSMQGITEELYLKYTNSTKEDIMAKMTEEATKRLKYRYLLMALIKEEKLEITDKELDEKVEELAKQYNMTGEEVKKELGNVEYLRNDMLFQKAIDLLKENN